MIESAMTKNVLVEDKKLSFVEERNYILKYDIGQIAKKSLAKCVRKYDINLILWFQHSAIKVIFLKKSLSINNF